MKRLSLVLFGLVIGSVIAEIVFLGLGESMSRTDMFIWPALALGWIFIALTKDRILHQNRKTIDCQARIIQNQAELLDQILTQDIDGRD